MLRYEVSKWDPIEVPDEVEPGDMPGQFRWFPFATALGYRGLMLVAKELIGRGYSEVSILVERIY